eukprot:1520149-Rhodomonas_salina.1
MHHQRAVSSYEVQRMRSVACRPARILMALCVSRSHCAYCDDPTLTRGSGGGNQGRAVGDADGSGGSHCRAAAEVPCSCSLSCLALALALADVCVLASVCLCACVLDSSCARADPIAFCARSETLSHAF